MHADILAIFLKNEYICGKFKFKIFKRKNSEISDISEKENMKILTRPVNKVRMLFRREK